MTHPFENPWAHRVPDDRDFRNRSEQEAYVLGWVEWYVRDCRYEPPEHLVPAFYAGFFDGRAFERVWRS